MTMHTAAGGAVCIGFVNLTSAGCPRGSDGASPSRSYITPAVPVSMGALTNSLGSVTRPVRADAATVRGEAR